MSSQIITRTKDLEKLGLIESQRKISAEDFSFATKNYLDKASAAADHKLQEIIEENINTLQAKHPNVVYKKNLENVALFVVK